MNTLTLKQCAQMALDVQDACNLAGVVISFAEVIRALDSDGNKSTTWRNNHPVSVLFANKCAALTGVEGLSNVDRWSEAFAECALLSVGGHIEKYGWEKA